MAHRQESSSWHHWYSTLRNRDWNLCIHRAPMYVIFPVIKLPHFRQCEFGTLYYRCIVLVRIASIHCDLWCKRSSVIYISYRSSRFCASWLLKTLQARTYLVTLQYRGRSSLFCSRLQSIKSLCSAFTRNYFKTTFGEGQGLIWSRIVATVPRISSMRGSSY